MDLLLLRGVGGRICFGMAMEREGAFALAIEVGMSIAEASCLWYVTGFFWLYLIAGYKCMLKDFLLYSFMCLSSCDCLSASYAGFTSVSVPHQYCQMTDPHAIVREEKTHKHGRMYIYMLQHEAPT